MDGERVGFAHLAISRLDGGYRMEAEGSVKMMVMGFNRDASSNECYTVGPDLSLRTFTVEQVIDGSRAEVKGEVTPRGLQVTIDRAGSRKQKTFKIKGTVYPPPALNLLPLMQQGKSGKKLKVAIFDPESVKVKQVTVTVEGKETVSGGEALHLKNDLYSFVENDIWISLQGNTIRESVRDDLVVTSAEDERSARSYLADAAVAKKDLVFDFSLIKVDTPIAQPDRLKLLAVDFFGIPPEIPMLQGERQRVTKAGDGAARFVMAEATEGKGISETPPTDADLHPAERIPSDAQEIVRQKDAILEGEKDPARKVARLVDWVAREIEGTVTESQSPLETLMKKSGNCQAHARLYTALARAAGVPTRFVSGVIYVPQRGFLYHSWAESYLSGRWLPVDPTLGQTPADLTHIKVAEGDTPDDMGVLAGIIGRVKAKVVEQRY